jgi:hypothetical protein
MVEKEMQRLGLALGIGDAHRMKAPELIRFIRLQEGELPCFSQNWSAPCKIKGCPICDACSSNPLSGDVGELSKA